MCQVCVRPHFLTIGISSSFVSFRIRQLQTDKEHYRAVSSRSWSRASFEMWKSINSISSPRWCIFHMVIRKEHSENTWDHHSRRISKGIAYLFHSEISHSVYRIYLLVTASARPRTHDRQYQVQQRHLGQAVSEPSACDLKTGQKTYLIKSEFSV